MTRVFVKLQGGLGNQLFQYSAGRAVAIRNNSELLLDTRVYGANRHRLYSLDHFCIKATIATSLQLPPPRTSRIRYEVWRNFGRYPRYVRERGLALNANVLSSGPECYLHGYFQSEGYFADVAKLLRSELTFRAGPVGLNREMMNRIAGENAVALHVRRGDYVSTGPEFHPVLGRSYYDAAIACITQQIDRPIIHIFSDCPEWVRENLHFDYPTVIHNHNQDAHRCHEDLRLMSACRHNITANSSFSWWGAWLNPNPKKIVITPKTWFGGRLPPAPDLVPSTWHRIAS